VIAGEVAGVAFQRQRLVEAAVDRKHHQRPGGCIVGGHRFQVGHRPELGVIVDRRGNIQVERFAAPELGGVQVGVVDRLAPASTPGDVMIGAMTLTSCARQAT